MHFVELTVFEQLGDRCSLIHRIDPRAKLIVTIIFIVAVMSLGKYEIAALLPFFLFPVCVGIIAELPFFFLLKRTALLSVFALMVGLFNPLLDQHIYVIGGLQISAGWLSFASILIRFVLTAVAALMLIATTGMIPLCRGLQAMKLPRIFILQLLFLYRYIFVLGDEAIRLLSARDGRSFNHRGKGIRTYGQLISSLLIRSISRAERIYTAMKSRGFNGEIRTRHQLHWQLKDTMFLIICLGLFSLFRLVNIPTFFGNLFYE